MPKASPIYQMGCDQNGSYLEWTMSIQVVQSNSGICCVIAVCIYRYVITFGLRSKYDMLGHYFRFMIVLPSINEFHMT